MASPYGTRFGRVARGLDKKEPKRPRDSEKKTTEKKRMSELCEYELEREQNIRENNEQLVKMGLLVYAIRRKYKRSQRVRQERVRKSERIANGKPMLQPRLLLTLS